VYNSIDTDIFISNDFIFFDLVQSRIEPCPDQTAGGDGLRARSEEIMPKKNSTSRGGAQRNRAHVQKNIELVRPTSATKEQEELNGTEQVPTGISTIEPETPVMQKPERSVNGNGNSILATKGVKAGRTSSAALGTPAAQPAAQKEEVPAESEEDRLVSAASSAADVASSAPKGSAAARIAARRQAAQRGQQRAATTLITPEHYAYVRKDLLFILILAIIMFSVIIILHFVPGIGY
jgi:hypothetical protein